MRLIRLLVAQRVLVAPRARTGSNPRPRHPRFRGWAATAFLGAPALIASVGRGEPTPATAPAGVAATRPATQGDVTFLDGQAAADALVDDRIEPYFGKLAAREMGAKTGRAIVGDTPEAMRAECVRRYRDGVRPFTGDERAALAGAVGQVRPALARVAPALAAVPWKFIKVADQIEFGFPHTRGGCLVLSEGLLRQLASGRRAGPQASAGVGILLTHEFAHVAERAHPAAFAKLYEGEWGFRRAKAIEPSAWLADRQLLNPDGVVCDWVYPVGDGDARRWVLPLIAFGDADPAAMDASGVGTIAVDLEPAAADGTFRVKAGPDGTPTVKPLAAEPAYAAAFGRGGNTYHPNEIAADLLAAAVAEELRAAADAPAANGAPGTARPPPARPGQTSPAQRRVEAFRAWTERTFPAPATAPAR